MKLLFIVALGIIAVVYSKTADAADFSGARVYHNATQAIGPSSQTALTFNSEVYDTDGYHDGINPQRLTAPVSGYYAVGASMAFASAAQARRLFNLIATIGGVGTDLARADFPTSTTNETAANLSADVYLNAGDYVRALAFQGTAGSVNVQAGSATQQSVSGFWIKRLDLPSGGASTWADITGKPDFGVLYCDADGTETDPDCAGADLSGYLQIAHFPAELANAVTCGGPELPPCEVELSAADRERSDLTWWGLWAIVGLLLALILAPRWYAAFRVTHGA